MNKQLKSGQNRKFEDLTKRSYLSKEQTVRRFNVILSENSDLDLAGLESNSHKSRVLMQGQGR